MVERLCRLVGHSDGAELSERGSLELLQKDLGSLIATTRNVPRGCKYVQMKRYKTSHLSLTSLLGTLRLCWLFMERSPHFRKRDLDMGRPVQVAHRLYIPKRKIYHLRGMPGDEAQLSTSTVTEETDTELGRLSTLT